MSRDVVLLFATRMLRMFGYGLLSVILVLYLGALGLSEARVGLLFTLTLVGDTAISLFITTNADRVGRRRMLTLGAVLMLGAGALLATTSWLPLLLLGATIGVVSPSGNEVGPFLAIEQSALSEEVAAQDRTSVFAWYNLAGSLATAVGALVGGGLVQLLCAHGFAVLSAYRAVVLSYGAVAVAMMALFGALSQKVEPPPAARVTRRPSILEPNLGLGPSRGKVFTLAGLFTLDSFAGGFVVQSFLAAWFHTRYGVSPATLGGIFFLANVLAGLSALSASRLAKRLGLLATMVGTHLPSNLLLLLVPLMPNLPLAIAMLLARFSISQMDVPTRQAYTMALVLPAERSAAAGVTGIARTIGASLAPLLAGPLFAKAALASVPFFLAGGIKIVYDLLVWRTFGKVRLPDAQPGPERRGVG